LAINKEHKAFAIRQSIMSTTVNVELMPNLAHLHAPCQHLTGRTNRHKGNLLLSRSGNRLQQQAKRRGGGRQHQSYRGARDGEGEGAGAGLLLQNGEAADGEPGTGAGGVDPELGEEERVPDQLGSAARRDVAVDRAAHPCEGRRETDGEGDGWGGRGTGGTRWGSRQGCRGLRAGGGGI